MAQEISKNEEGVILSKEGQVAIITFNRPAAMNTLTGNVCTKLIEIMDELERDESVRAVILTGAGEKAFCAGIDLSDRKGMSDEETNALRQFILFPCFHRLEDTEKPLIGAINGFALGGGAEIALICDIRVASERAKFGLTEVKWGIIPAAGACQRLPRIVGIGMAKELLLTGRMVDGKEGEKIGLFNRVTAPEDLMKETLQIANGIAENGPIAVRQIKKAVNFGSFNELAFAYDREASQACYHTQDRLEGIAAFNEKRKPQYKGR